MSTPNKTRLTIVGTVTVAIIVVAVIVGSAFALSRMMKTGMDEKVTPEKVAGYIQSLQQENVTVKTENATLVAANTALQSNNQQLSATNSKLVQDVNAARATLTQKESTINEKNALWTAAQTTVNQDVTPLVTAARNQGMASGFVTTGLLVIMALLFKAVLKPKRRSRTTSSTSARKAAQHL